MALFDRPFVDRPSITFPATAQRPTIRTFTFPEIYRNGIKRALDVVFVLLTMPLWLPIILVTAAIVSSDGHNPFYIQDRVGRHGRVFRMIKLRSMVHDAEVTLEAYLQANSDARYEWNLTQKLKFDPRITRTGRFIRKTSIDELPQLLNVLLGDMSLVGPRPMMVCQKPLYTSRNYYEMRPGLTGFWQISCRNACHFTARARYDNAYFKAMSLRVDLVVIWRTVGAVLRGTGY